jgi:hypothetical protein
MSEPYIMTVQNLPIEYRRPLLSIISQVVTHDIFKNPKHTLLQEYLTGLLTFLSSDTIVYNKFTEFLRQTAKDDRVTGMTMAAGNNRLYNILTTGHKQYYDQLLEN